MAPTKNARSSGARKPDVRALAAKLLQQVVEQHRSLDRVFEQARVQERDLPLLQELVTGSVRHFYSLDALVRQRLHRPLRDRDSIVGFVLITGAYQLLHTRIPDHAAVAETVRAAGRLGKPWAKSTVNTILRSIAAGAQLDGASPEAEFDHPQWLISAVMAQYPDCWEALLRENNRRAPMVLRVNLQRQSPEAYCERLAAQTGVESAPGWCEETLILSRPVPADQLPGFADGDVSVQDGGAQLATGVLDARAGQRVLDACAAPGGKALHILERTPGIGLVAVEFDTERCQVIERERRRLRLAPFELVRADATMLDWWDGIPFDRILVDAPCSGTGTIRRHPDIKLLKSADDLPAFARIQSKLLDNLWQCLARGGRMLYCTCSILAEENDLVIDEFLTRQPDAATCCIDAPWGSATRHGRQLLPEAGGADGFYYALLERRVP
jgi:16S rRNA (cytosine967-C5)-methyltransferase